MSDNTVRIDLELPSAEALALAQYLDRDASLRRG
jgi:hypothetical protein